MSVKKQYLKSRPECKVTFRLRKQEASDAKHVRLVGDFNHWNEQASPMKRLKSGDFTATLNLPIDTDYHFRYLLDDQRWENDWHADDYRPSPMSYDDNSVVRV